MSEYRRTKQLQSTGEVPCIGNGAADSGSISEQWTEQILDQFDPLGPTDSHESPAWRNYDPEDHASHALSDPLGDSDFGAPFGMPKNRYKGTIASQTL